MKKTVWNTESENKRNAEKETRKVPLTRKPINEMKRKEIFL